MVWATVLDKRPSGLRTRLLLSYLAVMLTLIGGAIVWVYAFTRHSLYAQLDQRLAHLAQAASHSLVAFKAHNQEPNGSADVKVPIVQRLDDDGDLDVPWQELREAEQGIEWFDAEKHLVGKAGTIAYSGVPQPGEGMLSDQIRAITLTIYAKDSQPEERYIEGYIRTSESIAEVSALLRQFRWGLGIGGGVLLGLTGLGGVWLTCQSLKPIEKSFQQLKQFTADAAHELRSPLATLKTSVQVMQCYPERIHPKDTQKLAAIATTTDQMIRLVEDLLLLSRMDDSNLVLSQTWAPVWIDQLLIEVIELLAIQAEEKQIKMHLDLTHPVCVTGDALQLQRLFRNLLENAIQYTPSEGVVTVSMVTDGPLVLVRVEDTGIGIAPAAQAQVFDRFWRADEARDRRKNGMGMGLSIAQTIAERHRGKVTVSSQVGAGSCFQVYLPLA